jgi:hypothetical protein
MKVLPKGSPSSTDSAGSGAEERTIKTDPDQEDSEDPQKKRFVKIVKRKMDTEVQPIKKIRVIPEVSKQKVAKPELWKIKTKAKKESSDNEMITKRLTIMKNHELSLLILRKSLENVLEKGSTLDKNREAHRAKIEEIDQNLKKLRKRRDQFQQHFVNKRLKEDPKPEAEEPGAKKEIVTKKEPTIIKVLVPKEEEKEIMEPSRHGYYKCLLCNYYFPTQAKSQIHKNVKHGCAHPMKIIDCDHCDEPFLEYSKLKVHKIMTHFGGKRLHCKFCKEDFFNYLDYFRHIVGHSFPICYICGQYFSDADQLTLHMKSHAKVDLHLACICGRVFVNKQFLESHKTQCDIFKTHVKKYGEIVVN